MDCGVRAIGSWSGKRVEKGNSAREFEIEHGDGGAVFGGNFQNCDASIELWRQCRVQAFDCNYLDVGNCTLDV
jgi:hypothetical protein